MEKSEYPRAENQGLEEDLFESVLKYASSINVNHFLNAEVISLSPGRAEMAMTVLKEQANSHGRAHGGMIAAFADSAMGVAIRTLNIRVVTIEMNINYLAQLNVGERLTTCAWVVHAGKSLVVAEAEVKNGEKLIAKSRATFYTVRRKAYEAAVF